MPGPYIAGEAGPALAPRAPRRRGRNHAVEELPYLTLISTTAPLWQPIRSAAEPWFTDISR
jgi:hypothetical protein